MDETGAVSKFDSQDVEKNKVLAIIGYIFPILFFIPLVTDAKNSSYAKFHSNQQLLLLIAGMVGGFALSIISAILVHIPFIGWIVALILPAYWLFLFILMIIGVINAANGAEKKLPIIGGLAVLIK